MRVDQRRAMVVAGEGQCSREWRRRKGKVSSRRRRQWRARREEAGGGEEYGGWWSSYGWEVSTAAEGGGVAAMVADGGVAAQKCSKTVTGKPCSNRGPSQQPSHESCGSAPPAGATSRGSCTDMSSKLSFGSEAVLLAGVSSAECIGLALAEAGGFFPNPNIVLV
nr:hypothetical protein Iba_chr08fCG4590 [Ipomoea batatas]